MDRWPNTEINFSHFLHCSKQNYILKLFLQNNLGGLDSSLHLATTPLHLLPSKIFLQLVQGLWRIRLSQEGDHLLGDTYVDVWRVTFFFKPCLFLCLPTFFMSEKRRFSDVLDSSQAWFMWLQKGLHETTHVQEKKSKNRLCSKTCGENNDEKPEELLKYDFWKMYKKKIISYLPPPPCPLPVVSLMVLQLLPQSRQERVRRTRGGHGRLLRLQLAEELPLGGALLCHLLAPCTQPTTHP